MGTSNGSISCILVEVNETTPVVLREKLNFHSTEIGPVVEALKKEALFLESFFMCSCNRTLLMFVCETRKLGIAKRRARALFNVLAKTKIPSKGIHVHVDRKAFRRFLRVALGIESPIFAEDQILGQIRLFYRIALERLES